jgi:hypothetical protein
MVAWNMTNIRKRAIMHATEAGKDTELREMSECIAKQIARIHVTPRGT